jgi:hypothetical protein
LSDLALSDFGVLSQHWESNELLGKAAEYRMTAMSRYRVNCLQSLAPALATGERVTLHPYGGDCDWAGRSKLDEAKRAALSRLVHRQCAEAMANWRVDPLLDGAMRELLSLCRERGIHVAIVLFPESSTFRSWYGEGVEDRLNEYLMTLLEEERVSIFDERAAMPDEAFIDPHHLSAEGASRFTAQFENHPMMRKLNNAPASLKCLGRRQNSEYDIVLRVTLSKKLVYCVASTNYECAGPIFLVNCENAPATIRCSDGGGWRVATDEPDRTPP